MISHLNSCKKLAASNSLNLLNILFLLTAGIFACPSVCAQVPVIQWQTNYGGLDYDFSTDIDNTNDGGFILSCNSASNISGEKTSNSFGLQDYCLVKLNSAGVIQWQKSYGGTSDDIAMSVEQTSDGGYIIGGYTSSGIGGNKTTTNYGNNDLWIIKTDSLGNIQWQREFGGIYNEYMADLHQTVDGGFILMSDSESGISGNKTDFCWGQSDFWVIKLNSSGIILWQNDIGGIDDETAATVETTSDGGYIISGSSQSGVSGDKTDNTNGSSDYWIVKLNSTGGIDWQNSIGGSSSETMGFAIPIADGGYFIGGGSASDISGDKTEAKYGAIGGINDIWVLKLNATGNIIWQNTIGGNKVDMAVSGYELPDGNFIVGGHSGSGINGDKSEANYGTVGTFDLWMLKLDTTGSIIWQKAAGGNQTEISFRMIPAGDGGFVITGASWSGISGNKTTLSQGFDDAWIVKINNECIPTVEICNAIDDDCNGIVDDGFTESISISAEGPVAFCKGESVVLTATYTGEVVQWLNDGVVIAGATSSTYTVTKKGTYSCITTSACASDTSTGIFVNVFNLPSAFISATGSTTFCTGGSVTLNETPQAGCTYQWYKGPSLIAGATTTSYMATTTGNYKCRVTKTATGCYKNSNTISVSVPCRESNTPLGGEGGLFTLYPNPANEILFISINELTNHDLPLLTHHSSLIITDIQGKEIFRSEINSLTTEINISDFASGMYFVKINLEGAEMIEKFIKN